MRKPEVKIYSTPAPKQMAHNDMGSLHVSHYTMMTHVQEASCLSLAHVGVV